MKPYIYAALSLSILLFSLTPAYSVQKHTEDVVYIIPVDGVIERGLLYVVRRGLAQAEKEGASTIVFHMNTPGGLVNVTEEIVRILIDLPKDVKTYTFIDKDALSAGAFISIATDEIYMAPGSRIGASAIVTLTGDIPEGDMKAKHYSATLALMQTAATRKGHDKDLIKAMMVRNFEYKIGKEVICAKGDLLTLTDLDATRLVGKGRDKHPLLASGTADNIDDLLKKINKSKARRITLETTWSEDIARWIELLGILFLAGGLLGIYIEFKTPGLGIPGISGIILLAIFFWGHNIAGLAGAGEVALFLLGIILLGVEIFLIPGFGVTGVAGILCMIAALGMAMVQHYPGGSYFKVDIDQLEHAATTLGAGVTLSFILMTLIVKFFPKTQLFDRIVLSTSLSREEGYLASSNRDDLIGMQGVTTTPLHPSGIGTFKGKRIDIIARGDFIEQDTPIIIAETHGNRIVVDIAETNNEG